MITLIKDATSTGVSESQTIIKDQDEGHAWHSVQVEFAGSPTALTVSIEGSITSNSFQDLATHVLTAAELAAGTAIFHILNKSLPVIRANIITLTGGVSPEVSVYYLKGIS
jgi:hypothetical protein